MDHRKYTKDHWRYVDLYVLDFNIYCTLCPFSQYIHIYIERERDPKIAVERKFLCTQDQPLCESALPSYKGQNSADEKVENCANNVK